ncbi:MAG: hypothetical protein ABL908_08295, partial [Hyphomicrobium sp.]
MLIVTNSGFPGRRAVPRLLALSVAVVSATIVAALPSSAQDAKPPAASPPGARSAAQPSAAQPAAAQPEAIASKINVLLARELRDVAPPLSLLDIAPPDDGVGGAKLAIADNNTTGKFVGQEFLLDIV